METIQVQLGFPIGLLDTVIWEPVDGLTFSGNDLAQLLRPTVEGIDDRVYTVTLIARNGCEAQAPFQVKVNTGRALFPPNVILQDATNLDNSAFTLYTKPGAVQEILMLKIFDRWGSEVFSREHFEPNIPSLGWNGDYKGKPLNPAVFVWWAKVSWADGTESIHKGDVTVLR